MTIAAVSKTTDVFSDSLFYATGRRDGNIQRYHKLDPTLFAMSCERAAKLAMKSGSKFSIDRFFRDYAESF